MAASAATVTDIRDGGCPNYRIRTFATTLAATATDGVEVALGWSQVDHCDIHLYSATANEGGTSYTYDRTTGILTLYGVTTGLDAAAVTVVVFGQD